MINKIRSYFKEFFKNDAGTYNLNVKRLDVKGSLYLIIGIVLAVIVTAGLVYLEVGEFDWNVFKFIWGEEAQSLQGRGLYRGGYFIGSFCALISFVLTGFFTTERINGDKSLLEFKIIFRGIFMACSIVAVICFIIANILY